MSAGDAVARLREALEDHGCQPRGGATIRARCPVHGSRGPTLAVRQGHAGAVIKCHAQCDTADVLAALGLVWADLADQPGEHNGHRAREPALERAARIINLRGEMLPLEPPTGWGERIELAEVHTAREADGHYWRTLARWAALARNERYVRQAYRDRAARTITYEQRMVLATRAEDLRREARP